MSCCGTATATTTSVDRALLPLRQCAGTAQHRGIAGLVIDGGCRDTAALRRRGFPVWAAGISVHGTVKAAPGLVNTTIAVGGVTVSPGDYVLAEDGVVVIAAANIDAVLDAAEARAAKGTRIFASPPAGCRGYAGRGARSCSPWRAGGSRPPPSA